MPNTLDDASRTAANASGRMENRGSPFERRDLSMRVIAASSSSESCCMRGSNMLIWVRMGRYFSSARRSPGRRWLKWSVQCDGNGAAALVGASSLSFETSICRKNDLLVSKAVQYIKKTTYHCGI